MPAMLVFGTKSSQRWLFAPGSSTSMTLQSSPLPAPPLIRRTPLGEWVSCSLCSHLLISHLIPNHLPTPPLPLTLITSSLAPLLLHPLCPPSSPYVPSQPLSCCPFMLPTPLFFLYTAGLLRNLGLKKKERMRQDSTLIYTVLACVHHSLWQQATPLFRGT